ncbi:uncharacterized protein [Amphiura filiformis]|uniref:uncharacterized protein n=1 Tax=Amphiura filiformis TaxID=82378 RepID=UPI003B21A52C
MRFIKNSELREWVKESLRKAIFQKAHALAVQTGCEVLIKLDDVKDTAECQYYATGALQKTYNSNQLKKSTSEVEVSGETGLPVTKMVDQGSQNSSDDGDDEEGDEEGHRNQKASASNRKESLPGGIRSSTSTSEESVTHQSQVKGELSEEDDMDDADDYDDEEEEMYRDDDDSQFLPTQVAYNGVNSKSDDLPETDVNDKDIKDEAQETTCALEGSVEPVESMPKQISLSVNSFNPGSTMEKEREPQIPPPDEKSTSSMNQAANKTSPDVGTSSQPMPAMSPSIRPYQCGVCQKTFGSIQVLSRHAQTFHGMNRGMRYYCNICGQSYKLAQYLQAHVKMHDTVTVSPVLCKVCGMGYYSDAALKQHELTHSTPSIPSEPVHTVSSPPDVQVHSKPNPRLQLSQTSSISGPKPIPTSSSSLKSSRPVEQSPTEAKRFKPSSPSEEKEETKDNSYHEPKQYHCLVCGMAFEEGEQLEEHVMRKHMQSDEPQAPDKSAGKLPPESDDVGDNSDQQQDTNRQSESLIKEEAKSPTPPPLSSQSFDQPGTSESSFMPSGPHAMSFPPFSALDNTSFGLHQSQSLPFPPAGPLLNPNSNITSVLEQALPGLLPGISLLSNPTQLPMAHAAASIAQSEGFPPMVSQDGRFTCDICGNSYKYNCTLKEHRLTHAQTPLFSCKICNQAFSRQRQLRDHMFRHSGQYPYHCKLCGKGFVRPSILRRHETDRHKQAWENMS